MDTQQTDIDKQLVEHFKALPKVVQDAITSADVQKHMRELADSHKLHLDQWQSLENEVMLTLMGLQPITELQSSLQSEVGLAPDIAASLAGDISKIVFEPIRGELERALDNPQAKDEQLSGVEMAGKQALAQEKAAAGAPPATVAPATPPAAPNTDKATRAPISESYKAGETSTQRKSVHDDPYREPPA